MTPYSFLEHTRTFRFDVVKATERGEHRHPPHVMHSIGFDWIYDEEMRGFDCWIFHCIHVPEVYPDFIKETTRLADLFSFFTKKLDD